MRIRIVSLLILLAMLMCALSSCATAGEVLKLVNNVLSFFTPDKGGIDNDFEINVNIPDPNRCTNHAIVPLEAIAPTCQTPGVSGGQACSKCGAVIVAQVELPALDHVYDGTQDKDCNACGFVREVKCEHLETEFLEAKAPTCTLTGRTQGEKCVGCGKIIAGYEILETIEHIYDGERDDTCNECNYVRKLACLHEVTKKLEAVAPSCTETGLTRGKECIHCGEILVAQQEVPTTDHIEGDWVVDKAPTETELGEIHTECTMCHTVLREGTLEFLFNESENASSGLAFELNEDKNSYTLVDMGDCTDTEIVIPSYYNGLPVTKIGEGAFLNKSGITSVVVPEGVLNIGNGAFRECVNLVDISLPSTVTSIGEYAFYGCALTSLSLPEGLTEIKQYTFYGCDFESIVIPYGVLSVGDYAFAECEAVIELSLPSSIEIIGKNAFYNLKKVATITLPRGLRTIGDRAFNCDELDVEARDIVMFNYVNKIGAYAFTTGSNINYKGKGAEWNSILIDPRNYQYNVTTLDGAFVD